MNLLLSHALRRGTAGSNRVVSTTRISAIACQNAVGAQAEPWICHQCMVSEHSRNVGRTKTVSRDSSRGRRYITTSARRWEETRKRIDPISTNIDSSGDATSSDASLPSKTDARRWQISKRLSHMMDTILARASIYGQHINVYTGTDYSGIETLRKEINDQEQKVRVWHKTIETSRSTHHEAHAQQASAQKEIVSLLERKSSWSPTDLERYMSLVRSEHTMEQDVVTAKENLRAAERDLESARSLLERLERKQYHEEQIWSDTIRRNSTWVTFVLMGVNIFLLLAQIAIFEPYRRRKIVKEVNMALNEKAVAATSMEVERQIDQVMQPERSPLEILEQTSGQAAGTSNSMNYEAGEVPLAAGEVLPEEAVSVSISSQSFPRRPTQPHTWSDNREAYKEGLQDLFSERIIQVKKVDLTTTALQGAATGVATIGLLFLLWRPR